MFCLNKFLFLDAYAFKIFSYEISLQFDSSTIR